MSFVALVGQQFLYIHIRDFLWAEEELQISGFSRSLLHQLWPDRLEILSGLSSWARLLGELDYERYLSEDLDLAIRWYTRDDSAWGPDSD